MKIVRIVSICSIFLLQMAVEAQEVKKEINLQKSQLKWTGKKLAGSHTGTLQFKKGSLIFRENQLVSGEFVVDMTTLQVTDLQGKGKMNLEKHLKNDDFFGVDKHKESHLKITHVNNSVIVDNDNRKDMLFEIKADLTIKNITKPVKFTMRVMDDKRAKADLTIDRTQYGIKYKSKSFFSDLGDKVIYDDFEIVVDLEFN